MTRVEPGRAENAVAHNGVIGEDHAAIVVVDGPAVRRAAEVINGAISIIDRPDRDGRLCRVTRDGVVKGDEVAVLVDEDRPAPSVGTDLRSRIAGPGVHARLAPVGRVIHHGAILEEEGAVGVNINRAAGCLVFGPEGDAAGKRESLEREYGVGPDVEQPAASGRSPGSTPPR